MLENKRSSRPLGGAFFEGKFMEYLHILEGGIAPGISRWITIDSEFLSELTCPY
jgi:hypothetical protein